jgi:hypothetical protein
MMNNDQFGWWEKSICMGLINQLLSTSQVYIKKFFLSNYWNPMFFFLCSTHRSKLQFRRIFVQHLSVNAENAADLGILLELAQ